MNNIKFIVFILMFFLTFNAFSDESSDQVLEIYGYGYSRSKSYTLALENSKNWALNTLADQINGKKFTFSRNDNQVTLKLIQKAVISGYKTEVVDIIKLSEYEVFVIMKSMVLIKNTNRENFTTSKKTKEISKLSMNKLALEISEMQTEAIKEFIQNQNKEINNAKGKIFITNLELIKKDNYEISFDFNIVIEEE